MTTPIREKLAELYRGGKEIRKGKLLTFYGVVGGKNNSGGSPLIIDVVLADTMEYVADHIFLSMGSMVDVENYSTLRAYKKNKLKGRAIEFSAIITKYDRENQYGLRLTNDSYISLERYN